MSKQKEPSRQRADRQTPGDLYSQLSNVAPKIRRQSNRNSIKDPSKSPELWIGDGIDHINIWDHAQTDLGKLLAHSSPLTFNHKIFGRFASMEAFWHYIQSEERDDRIRTMSGKTLIQFARKLTKTNITNFRAIIMDSNYQRIKMYEPLVDAIRESELPFDCYFENTEGLKQRPAFFKWLIKGFEEIRKAIKQNREPEFRELKDKPHTEIYEFVMPKSRRVAEKTPQAAPQKPALFSKVTEESQRLTTEAKRGETEVMVQVDELAFFPEETVELSAGEELTAEGVEGEVISGDELTEAIRSLIHINDQDGEITIDSDELTQFVESVGGTVEPVKVNPAVNQ